jgi:hypothetical protein
MLRRSCSIVLAMAMVVLGAHAALALLIDPVKVYDPPASQSDPSRNAAWLLYASNTKDRPQHWDALARPVAGGTPEKLNAKGTKGYPGGFDPGTNTVIFEEYTSNAYDIRMFNLDSMQREPTPRPVHTGAIEFDPRISTSYISFFRYQKMNGVWYANLYLLDRSDDSLKKLTSIKSKNGQYVLNDFLGEHNATWTVCAATCIVRVYDIDAKAITKLPSTSDDKPQYGSTIDETVGALFFVRSGFGCGVGVTIWRVPLADLHAAPTKLASLPKGQDISNSMSLDSGDLLFGKYPCTGWGGIFALPGADT